MTSFNVSCGESREICSPQLRPSSSGPSHTRGRDWEAWGSLPPGLHRGAPTVGNERWQRISRRALLLRGMAGEAADRFMGGGEAVPQIRLSLRRACPWLSHAPPCTAVPDATPYVAACTACNVLVTLPGKPVKLAVGWPFHYCPGCHRKRRIGRFRCRACTEFVMSCKCHGRQCTLFDMWR